MFFSWLLQRLDSIRNPSSIRNPGKGPASPQSRLKNAAAELSRQA